MRRPLRAAAPAAESVKGPPSRVSGVEVKSKSGAATTGPAWFEQCGEVHGNTNPKVNTAVIVHNHRAGWKYFRGGYSARVVEEQREAIERPGPVMEEVIGVEVVVRGDCGIGSHGLRGRDAKTMGWFIEWCDCITGEKRKVLGDAIAATNHESVDRLV